MPKTAKKKVKCDGPTDRQTDGPTKRVVESRSTGLKINARYIATKMRVGGQGQG